MRTISRCRKRRWDESARRMGVMLTIRTHWPTARGYTSRSREHAWVQIAHVFGVNRQAATERLGREHPALQISGDGASRHRDLNVCLCKSELRDLDHCRSREVSATKCRFASLRSGHRRVQIRDEDMLIDDIAQ